MAWDIGFDQTYSSSSSSSRSSSSSSSSSSFSSSSSSSRSSSSSSSRSSSSSSSSAIAGTVTYGQHTGVEETFDLNFQGEATGWSITGTPGTDNEAIDATSCGQIVTFRPHNLGAMTAIIRIDKYQTGSGPAPIIQYRTAANRIALFLAAWNVYNGVSFTSLGWIQIRFIHS